MANTGEAYAVSGNRVTDQAEASTANRGSSTINMRVLIELQVISLLLHEIAGSSEDLARMRQDVADSIT